MKEIPFNRVLSGLAILVLVLLSWHLVGSPSQETTLLKGNLLGQAEAAQVPASPRLKPHSPIGTLPGDPPRSKLVLKELRPNETRAGQVFNRQPNGEAAIVCMTENGTSTVVILFNGEKLETVFGDAGWLSASVPKKFYRTPGDVKVYLLDQKTNAKSNELVFRVKP